MKKMLFNFLFTKEEQTIIINALYYQEYEYKDMIGVENRALAYRCRLLANKLMNW